MKKSSFRIITAALVLFFNIICVKAGTFIDGLYYNFNKTEHTATLTYASSYFGGYSGDVVIPSQVIYEDETYDVVAISEDCFTNCTNLTSVTIPASVTIVGSKNSGNSFYKCTGLKRVVLEDGENPIIFQYDNDNGNTGPIFRYSQLESIYVGRNIEMKSQIYSPFKEQTSLTDVIIGSCVTALPDNFICKSAVSEIILPNGLKSIGNKAFYECKNLKKLIIPNSVTSIGSSLCYSSGVEEVYSGSGVETIPSTAFRYCSQLKTVCLGQNTKKIESSAFGDCTNLSKLYIFSDELMSVETLPETITTIYVPKPTRYATLLSGYNLDCLLSFNDSESFYTGEVPILSYYNNTPIQDISYTIDGEYFNAGVYTNPIEVSFKYDSWEASIKIPATYTIKPATLTIIANDVSRKYGEENPELTCSYFGFKNNETSADLKTLPTIETTATLESNVGTYPIIPYGAASQNYDITHERGTLTITKADQLIEWEQDFGDVSVGDIVELEAKSSAGLQIKYTVTDESIAEIFTQSGKKCVEFLKEGKVSIRANQEGNENYNEADRVSKTITVLPQSGVETILADNTANIRVYNLNGSYISDSLYNLCPGFYIVKQGTKMKKVVIK